jgi:hypothetical protein
MAVATRGAQGRWTDGRIDRELRELVRELGAEQWPSKAQFKAAGRDALLRAIYADDGTRAWAARLGLEWRGRPRRRTNGGSGKSPIQ